MQSAFVVALFSLVVCTEVLAAQAAGAFGVVHFGRPDSAFRSPEHWVAAPADRGLQPSRTQSTPAIASFDDVRVPLGPNWAAVPDSPRRTGLARALKGALIGAAVGAVVGYAITSPCALGHGDDFVNMRAVCSGGRQFGALVLGTVGFVVGIPLGALLR